MKKPDQWIVATTAVAVVTFAAFAAEPPAGMVELKNVPAEQVLTIYKDLSRCEMIESSDVKLHYRAITARSSSMSTREDTLKLIETAFLEQAGIVITRLGGKRVSVTFNDHLPVKSPP
ncbi:MAG TPA: hypothetical protein VEH04_16620 [Verrucomicrobiae bacterium]|nr:hypothetical protein [Verrucomicrobiae bacterium]